MRDSSPVERELAKRYEDAVEGKPLSRRARQTKRSVESYLAAGLLPRYMQRLRDIEDATRRHRRRLAAAYEALREECGEDDAQFARRWRAVAHRWRFDEVNELIREHNEWYPVESGLPLDPRTRDYVRLRGRSYRRSELTPQWALDRFPPRGV
ncbi:MAG TPA: hypothetical protein VD790_04330 [Thermoleophilaceae bacterium]|nr:hypothetical protein [Thermoleophilaceae bacterium]